MDRQLAEAKEKLRAEMQAGNAGQNAAQLAQIEKQKKEYGRRGIRLAEFDRAECKDPYLLNQDLDEFRSGRFMFVLDKEEIIFGTDTKPMDFGIVERHCIIKKGADNKLTLVGADGDTYHNGVQIDSGAEIALSAGDRVVMSNVMTLLYIPGTDLEVYKSTEEIAQEFRGAKMSDKDSSEMQALQAQKDAWEAQKKQMEEQMEALRLSQNQQMSAAEKEKAQAEAAAMKKKLAEEENKQVEARNRSIMLDLIPKVDEACRMLKLLNRGMMQCEAMLRVGKFCDIYCLLFVVACCLLLWKIHFSSFPDFFRFETLSTLTSFCNNKQLSPFFFLFFPLFPLQVWLRTTRSKHPRSKLKLKMLFLMMLFI